MCKTHMEKTSQLFRKTQPIRKLMGQLNNVELTKLIHDLIHCKAKSMLIKITQSIYFNFPSLSDDKISKSYLHIFGQLYCYEIYKHKFYLLKAYISGGFR